MNLSEIALKNKTLIFFVVFVLVVGGIYSFFTMSKLEDPAITVKEAMVITPYPGASAYEVELEVTDLIEKSIRTMGNIDHITSRSLDDASWILVELKSTVPKADLQQHWDILRHKVANIQSQLPQGCRTPQILDNFGDVYGIFYAMTSDGFSTIEMMNYANLYKREILNIDGVSNVETWGEHPNAIEISIKQDKMANLGIHPAELILTLKGENQTVYSGYFDSGNYRLRVSVSGQFKTSEDIGLLLIEGHENDKIRLKDIAEIHQISQTPIRESLHKGDLPAIGIAISMKEGGNIIQLGKKVEDKIEELNKTIIPAGIKMEKVFYQPTRVKDAIEVFMLNLFESIIIVIIIVMLFMGFKGGLAIGSCLLIIVLGSFLILNLMHGTLQRVSLASFIVAMGMLVDNAIVILDGIKVDIQKGIPSPKCLTGIGQKTGWPLLGATTIGILAFYPIFLSPDTTGEYVRDLFIVLAVSLWLSWLLALAYTPIQAKHYFLNTKKKNKEEGAPFQGKVYDRYRKLLGLSIKFRYGIVILTVILLLISVWAFQFIKQGFFPDLSYDQLYVEYKMPYGTSPQYIAKELEKIKTYLYKQEGVTSVTTSLGGTPARYNLVRTIAEPALSYGEFIIDFTSPKTLKRMMPKLQTYLSAHHPKAYIRFKRYNLMYTNFPIQYQILGPNPDTLQYLAQRVQKIMYENPNVMLIKNNWGEKTLSLSVAYNQPNARTASISRSDLSLSLLASTEGLPIDNYYLSYHSLLILLKNVNVHGNSIRRLNDVPVWSALPRLNTLSIETIELFQKGAITKQDLLTRIIGSTQLESISNGIDISWETPIVRRYNGQRAIAVQCTAVEGVTTNAARKSILPDIEEIKLPPGYSAFWQGEYLDSQQSEYYLFRYIPIAVILIFLILILLFKDLKRPFIILLCLPIAIIGMVIGMLVANKEFGFVAIVGVLGLMGMMIKNGVVLVDEIDDEIRNGKHPYTAVIEGSTTRIKPVFLAALTTILGMIPLINDDMFGSLAVTIMGGLFVGTIITLLFLPILYTLFTHIKYEDDKK